MTKCSARIVKYDAPMKTSARLPSRLPAAPALTALKSTSFGTKSRSTSGVHSRTTGTGEPPRAARTAAAKAISDAAAKSSGASGWKVPRKPRLKAKSAPRRQAGPSGKAVARSAAATKAQAVRLISSTSEPRGALAAPGDVGGDLVDALEGRERQVLVADADAVGRLDHGGELGQAEGVEDALVDQRLAVLGQETAVAADLGREVGPRRLLVDRRAHACSWKDTEPGSISCRRRRFGMRAILPLEVL